MTAPSHYGCTGSHNEFTCLDQYYQTTGRRKFRHQRWCPTCKAKYRDPEQEASDEPLAEDPAFEEAGEPPYEQSVLGRMLLRLEQQGSR